MRSPLEKAARFAPLDLGGEAEEHRELICGMNLSFVEGLLEGLGAAEGFTARLDPAPGYCCVRIAAR